MFDLFLALHVLAAVAGFAALGTTGAYASALRRSSNPFVSLSIVRFFAPGRNLAARSVLVVPVFGAVLLGLGHDVGRLYPWLGLMLWCAAMGVASAVVWPGERRIQACLAEGPSAPGDPVADLRRCARRIEHGAAGTSLCFVAALVVMLVQPA